MGKTMPCGLSPTTLTVAAAADGRKSLARLGAPAAPIIFQEMLRVVKLLQLVLPAAALEEEEKDVVLVEPAAVAASVKPWATATIPSVPSSTLLKTNESRFGHRAMALAKARQATSVSISISLLSDEVAPRKDTPIGCPCPPAGWFSVPAPVAPPPPGAVAIPAAAVASAVELKGFHPRFRYCKLHLTPGEATARVNSPNASF